MKKAVAKKTVKLNRVVYLEGSVFTEPYPEGVQREINEETGTIEELESVGEKIVHTETFDVDIVNDKEETEKDKKARLREYAVSEFGVTIHFNTGLAEIERVIADLKATRPTDLDLPDDVGIGSDEASGE